MIKQYKLILYVTIYYVLGILLLIQLAIRLAIFRFCFKSLDKNKTSVIFI